MLCRDFRGHIRLLSSCSGALDFTKKENAVNRKLENLRAPHLL